jgi:hypothetical protein
VEWYTRRWMIERFQHVLKSGCRVEHLQLGATPSFREICTLSHLSCRFEDRIVR